MSDGSAGTPGDGDRPDGRDDGGTGRLLEDLVRTMTAMEDGLQPATALDGVATPLAARRIQSMVLTERAARAERRRRGSPRPRTVPAIVRTSSCFHPTAGVTEGVVLVREDRRTRAYCVRLEQHGADWRVVELARPDTALRPVVTRASREGRLAAGASDPSGPSRRRGPSCALDGVDQDGTTPSVGVEEDEGDDTGDLGGGLALV